MFWVAWLNPDCKCREFFAFKIRKFALKYDRGLLPTARKCNLKQYMGMSSGFALANTLKT
jgi:hypothetical protein